MRVYKKANVYDAALERIRYLFNEFDNIIVGYSGGKDSTICLELSLIVAKELNRLPLKVMFLDQESEWQGTIDIVEEVMTREDVEPMWFQIPIKMSNNASSYERFAQCWNPETPDKWVHPKHPLSIKENTYGDDTRFHDMFAAILKKDYADTRTCYIAGVRTDESPKRFVALTYHPTYKWITWAKKLNRGQEHYTFYPIYDWNTQDVWKAIHDNNWLYNKRYDDFYQKGMNVREMRISNLHHETALQSLLRVQEIEPETWLRLQAHIEGANSLKHLQFNAFTCPKELPYMFESWEEYAYHLADNIIQDQENKDKFYHKVGLELKIYEQQPIRNEFFRTMITTILSSDWDFTKFVNWQVRPDVYGYRTFMAGKRDKSMMLDTRWFSLEQLQELFTSLGIKHE